MSTIKVNKIENTSTTNGGVSIDNDGHVTIDGQQLPTAGPLSNRNIIINGAMQVAQRNTTETKTQYSGYPVCDRWRVQLDNASQATFTQETSGGPSGFPTFFKWNVDSVDSSIATASNVYLNQRIEGLNLQSLGYGTASAKSMTMSFYVKSNRTGTYVLEITNPAGSRHIAKTYTIDSADTWEYKTIVFPGDTTQSVANNNNEGFRIKWWLQAGTNFTSGTLATTWAAQSNPNSAAGQSVNLHDDAGANWNITGVQLEVGSKSTPFEHRSYADELLRCQRYCYQISAIDETTTHLPIAVGTMWAADFFIGICNTPVSIRNPFDVDLEVSDIGDVFVLSRGTVATPTTLNNNPHHYGNQIEVHFTVSKTIGDGAWARLKPGLGNFFRIISEL